MRTPRRHVLRLFAALAANSVMPARLALSYDGPPVPDSAELIDLVHSTMQAVDEGNKTGSYAALHAMGSPAFKTSYPLDKLAGVFAKLRASGADLSALKNKTPLTSRAPTLDLQGRLRILGYYELPGEQIVYDVLYDYDPAVRGWLLAAISVNRRGLPPQPELMQPR